MALYPPQLMPDALVVDAMEMYGGSFVSALARTARYADDRNLMRIKDTWADYWKEYSDIAKIVQQKQNDEQAAAGGTPV